LGAQRTPSSQFLPRVNMPLIMYPFTCRTGKVAGTFAMPTVTPCLERTDQKGSSFNMLVLAVTPPTTKPVMPFCSGGVLVAIVIYTFGQFGAGKVRSLPYTPAWMSLSRLGSSPCRSRGRRMSHSMPLTPITMTRGLGGGEVCAERVAAAMQAASRKSRMNLGVTAEPQAGSEWFDYIAQPGQWSGAAKTG